MYGVAMICRLLGAQRRGAPCVNGVGRYVYVCIVQIRVCVYCSSVREEVTPLSMRGCRWRQVCEMVKADSRMCMLLECEGGRHAIDDASLSLAAGVCKW